MKYVIEAFSILFALMAGLYGSVSVISVSGQIAAAKEYKADVIAEIENSNFNSCHCVKRKYMWNFAGWRNHRHWKKCVLL